MFAPSLFALGSKWVSKNTIYPTAIPALAYFNHIRSSACNSCSLLGCCNEWVTSVRGRILLHSRNSSEINDHILVSKHSSSIGDHIILINQNLLHCMFHAFWAHKLAFLSSPLFQYSPQPLLNQFDALSGICNTSTYCAAISASSLVWISVTVEH
jgi:hypothetical protein